MEEVRRYWSLAKHPKGDRNTYFILVKHSRAGGSDTHAPIPVHVYINACGTNVYHEESVWPTRARLERRRTPFEWEITLIVCTCRRFKMNMGHRRRGAADTAFVMADRELPWGSGIYHIDNTIPSSMHPARLGTIDAHTSYELIEYLYLGNPVYQHTTKAKIAGSHEIGARTHLNKSMDLNWDKVRCLYLSVVEIRTMANPIELKVEQRRKAVL